MEVAVVGAPFVEWLGASGTRYKYYVYELSHDLGSGQDGNYILAREITGGWEAVYVGQGDLEARKTAAMNEGCVTQKGATHFHCHLNPDESARLAEESDVLAGNPEAYEPRGCNHKVGG
jgi:hypothetical protein